MNDNSPDQCVTSKYSVIEFDEIIILREGREYRVPSATMTVEEWCKLTELDFRTLQKRRQRGDSWSEAIDPKLKRKPRPVTSKKPYKPCRDPDEWPI